MSKNVTSGNDRNVSGGAAADLGEIHSFTTGQPVQLVARPSLLPQEEVISLPPSLNSLPTPLAPLTRFLGPSLTVANPVWSGDPVPRLRALQKKLVEHSLTLAECDRSDFMAAITVVETAVRLRLRYQQMRMNEAEMNLKPESAGGR